MAMFAFSSNDLFLFFSSWSIGLTDITLCNTHTHSLLMYSFCILYVMGKHTKLENLAILLWSYICWVWHMGKSLPLWVVVFSLFNKDWNELTSNTDLLQFGKKLKASSKCKILLILGNTMNWVVNKNSF